MKNVRTYLLPFGLLAGTTECETEPRNPSDTAPFRLEIEADSAMLSIPSCGPDALPRYPEQARWLAEQCGSVPGVSQVWHAEWLLADQEAVEHVRALLSKYGTLREDQQSPDRPAGGE